MMLIEADGMTNSENPDQTAPFNEQSDQGLQYLSVLPVLILSFYGIQHFIKNAYYSEREIFCHGF